MGTRLEGVCCSSLQSIVVPTPDDAARAAQWLRENNGGRASFLVAGLHGGSEESNVQTNALACGVEERPALSISFANEAIAEDLKISDLLGAPRELLSVLRRTLPDKMNARLASNLDDAMTKSLRTGEVFVTLNGDWVQADNLSAPAMLAHWKKARASYFHESCESWKARRSMSAETTLQRVAKKARTNLSSRRCRRFE